MEATELTPDVAPKVNLTGGTPSASDVDPTH